MWYIWAIVFIWLLYWFWFWSVILRWSTLLAWVLWSLCWRLWYYLLRRYRFAVSSVWRWLLSFFFGFLFPTLCTTFWTFWIDNFDANLKLARINLFTSYRVTTFLWIVNRWYIPRLGVRYCLYWFTVHLDCSNMLLIWSAYPFALIFQLPCKKYIIL